MIGIVLSHSIMEIIFAFDLKAAIKHLASGAVGAVLVFTIFIVFKFDLTGYDKWVPNPQKVESIALDLPVFFDTGYYDFENDYWSGSAEYKFDHMELTDTENICAFMESVMSEDVESVAEDGEKFLWGTVKYRMKNGKENIIYLKRKILQQHQKLSLPRIMMYLVLFLINCHILKKD